MAVLEWVVEEREQQAEQVRRPAEAAFLAEGAEERLEAAVLHKDCTDRMDRMGQWVVHRMDEDSGVVAAVAAVAAVVAVPRWRRWDPLVAAERLDGFLERREGTVTFAEEKQQERC